MATPDIVAEYEQLALEDAGETPQPETPAEPATKEEVEQFEYLIGEKSNQLPGDAQFSIKHDGEIRRIPAKQLINAYREFTHLKPKFQNLTENQKKFEAERGEYDKYLEQKQALYKYEQLQQWSEKNPEAFEHLWTGLQKAENGLYQPNQETAAVPDALNSKLTAMNEKLAAFEEWKTAQEAERQEQKIQQDMKQIDEESVGFEDKYLKPYGMKLDDQVEGGLPLKSAILKHGVDENLTTFRAAGLSYLNDTLLERAAQRGRTEAMKGVKGDTSKGIISRSLPGSGKSDVDVKKMSPDERNEAALAEFLRMEAAKQQ